MALSLLEAGARILGPGKKEKGTGHGSQTPCAWVKVLLAWQPQMLPVGSKVLGDSWSCESWQPRFEVPEGLCALGPPGSCSRSHSEPAAWARAPKEVPHGLTCRLRSRGACFHMENGSVVSGFSPSVRFL